ncbi:unnamed protein product [Bemisia tabaci]|uniref:DNA replication complex GINS protein PSF3 n=1 Tax=Bemisia tabaci TaxID=7038 RepID=A0A9P0F455_BEMTA|nr:PREDICTED: DNA replication complex GINS protein PSF3 [Bemisia tabaci]CAH0391299.1 unnamed protein product [Bemisia tabaci]
MKLCRSHYFDLEDILASHETMPATFTEEVKGLGFLDPGAVTDNITPKTKLELPFWILQVLLQLPNKPVTVELPKAFNATHRDIFSADACIVDFNKLCKFFYTFGKILARAKLKESPEIKKMLVETFKQRFRYVFDLSQNVETEKLASDKMDRMERELYNESRTAQVRLNQWMSVGIGTIQAASMIVNHRKRKLTVFEL